MKICLALLLVMATLAPSVFGQSRAIELDPETQLIFTKVNGLKITSTPATPGKPGVIVVEDEQQVYQMRIKLGTLQQEPTKEWLQQFLAGAAQRFLANAVEEKIEVKNLAGGAFELLYFEMTDKREDPGDGRYMVQGIGVSGRTIAQFIMLSNQVKPEAKQAIFEALKGMELKKTK